MMELEAPARISRTDDVFPPLRRRREQATEDPNAEVARQALWNAYQRGALSEEEFATTLERM